MAFWNWKKKTQEEPVTEVIELNRDVALSEAASTLGRAGDLASRQEDTDNLLQVAAGWIQLSHRLDGPEDAVLDSVPRVMQTGFAPGLDLTIPPEVPDPDVEDKCRIRIYYVAHKPLPG